MHALFSSRLRFLFFDESLNNLEIEKIEVLTAEVVRGNCSLKHFREKDS